MSFYPYNFFMSTEFDPIKAFILATGCGLSYDISQTAQFDNFKEAINATSYQRYGQINFRPAYTIYHLNPTGKIVCFAGINTASQFFRYFLLGGPASTHYGTGHTSAVVDAHYQLIRSSIVADLTAGATGSAPNSVVFAAHSAGGPFVMNLINDLMHNHPTLINPRSAYLFGSPKAGDQALIDGCNPCPVYNVCNQDDWIPKFPAVNATTSVRLVDSAGNVTVQSQAVNFVNGGTHYRIDHGDIAELPSYDGIFNNTSMARAWQLISQLTLPEDHNIEAYKAALYRFVNRMQSVRRNSIAGIKDFFKMAALTETPDQPANNELALGDLNPIRGNSPIPPAPSGGTATFGRSAVLFAANINAVTDEISRVRGMRAYNGDGHEEKAIKKMRSLMNEINKKENGVKWGTRRGTQLLFGDTAMSEQERLAWYDVQNFINSLELD